MNKIILVGRHTKDPEMRYTQSGTAVTSFTLAVNRNRTNQNGEREADFINCVAWGKTGEFVAQYFTKGQQMALEGRLQVRTYDDQNGNRHWITEVVADQVEFCGSKGDKSGNNNTNSTNGNNGNYNTGGGGSYAPYDVDMGEEIVFDDGDLPF